MTMTRDRVESQIKRLESEIAEYRIELRSADKKTAVEVLFLVSSIGNANAAIDARVAYLAKLPVSV